MNPDSSQAALANLQQIQSQSQDPNSILSGQRQQLGVDQAQQTVTGLRGAINNTTKLLKQVAPSVMGRTGSSLVTNAQATKQISNEQAPINQTLTDQGTQLGQDQQDLSDLNSKAQEAASGIYQGQQDKLSYAQNIYNTLYQKEKDAQAQAQAEADRQEQIRQFNEQQAAAGRAASAAAGSGNFNLGGGSATPPAVNPQQAQAQAALTGLFKTNNVNTIANTIKAIQSSAARGNTYDQLKLQLLGQYANTAYGSLLSKAQSLLKNNTTLKAGGGNAGLA